MYRAVGPDGEVALEVVMPDVVGRRAPPYFLRNARSSARLRHPHLLRVLDAGRFGEAKESVFLARHLVCGVPLRRLLDVGLETGAAVGIVVQLCEALAYIHAREVFPRRITPDNVFVERDPKSGNLHARLDSPLETIARTTPEEAESRSPEFDMYSVGLLLHRLLTGKTTPDDRITDRDGAPLPSALAAVVTDLLAPRVDTAADAVRLLRDFTGPARCTSAQWRDADGPEQTIRPMSAGPASGAPVGRGRELGRMEYEAEKVEAGVGRVIVLRGAPAVGKTAILDEFARQLAEAGRFHVFRIANRNGRNGVAALRAALERMLGPLGRDRSAIDSAAHRLIADLGSEPDDAQAIVEFLRGANQTAEGPALRDQHHALMVRLLRALATRRPVLLTIDDASGGGADTAAFLGLLLFELGFEPARILAVTTVRDGENTNFESVLARTDRLENRSRITLNVGPLVPHAGVDTRHGRGSSDPGSRAIEEIGRSFGEDRELSELLMHVAVLGVSVPTSLLAASLGRGEALLDDQLHRLVEEGALRDGPDDTVELDPVLRDAVLAETSPEQRRRLHIQAAGLRGTDPHERVARAEHLSAAGSVDDAAEAWLLAFQAALASGEADLAARAGRTALAMLPEQHPKHARVAVLRGRLLADSGDPIEAERALLPVVDDPDADTAMTAVDMLGELYEQGDDVEVAWKELLERAGGREKELGPTGRRSLARARARWFNAHGPAERAITHAAAALEGAVDAWGRQRAARLLSSARMLTGDVSGATVAARWAVNEAAGHSNIDLRSRRMLLELLIRSGTGVEATELAREVLHSARRMGATTNVPVSLLDLGRALRAAGEHAEARRQFAGAARAARELGVDRAEIHAQFHLVVQDLMAERPDGTVETMAWLAQRARSSKLVLVEASEKPLAAWASVQRGAYDRARALLADAAAAGIHAPSVPAVGYTAEGLALAFEQGFRGGRANLRSDALRAWTWAERIWTECGRKEARERAKAAVHRLS